MAEGKRTPLFPVYAEYGARTVDFGGWELPLQFSGILTEHEAVRRAVGLFDVSHMGEIEVSGPQALAVVQRVITNDAARLRDGRALYSPICRPDGGILDDVLVYRFDPRRFLIVVNAANRQRDVEHWQAVAADLAGDQAQVRDASDDYALLALQGPRAAAVLARLYEGPEELSPLGLKPFAFVTDVPLAGRRARLVSRTGYTGEDGFELYLQPEDAIPLWRALLVAGEAEQIQPAGLGARDTLRFEACLPLYGNELTEDTNPWEAGLDAFVKLDKGDFIGRDALLRVRASGGPRRRLVGLELSERGIARHGYPVTDLDGRPIGHVTSGTLSPTLGRSLALAYVPSQLAGVGSELAVVIHGRPRRARVVPTPFYRRGQA